MKRLRGNLDRDRGDSGMTLVELMVTSSVLLVLMGMVFISITMVEGLNGNISSQYQEFQQAVPAMAPFHSLLAAEVEPAPPQPANCVLAVSCVPTPGFASIGNFSLTFYANIGTAYNNTVSCPQSQSCTTGGTTAGPAKIWAVELDASGAPATACNVTAPCTFQVRMYLPLMSPTGPGISSCPDVGTGPTCQYSATNYQLMANVQDVVNDPSGASGGNLNNPIFSYTIMDTGGNWPIGCVLQTPPCTSYPPQAIVLTQAEIQSAGQVITGLNAAGYPIGGDTQPLSACAAPSANYPTAAIACPADAIQSVSVDLQIAKPGTAGNQEQEDNLVVYRYAQSPGSSTAPYQYSTAVG